MYLYLCIYCICILIPYQFLNFLFLKIYHFFKLLDFLKTFFYVFCAFFYFCEVFFSEILFTFYFSHTRIILAIPTFWFNNPLDVLFLKAYSLKQLSFGLLLYMIILYLSTGFPYYFETQNLPRTDNFTYNYITHNYIIFFYI